MHKHGSAIGEPYPELFAVGLDILDSNPPNRCFERFKLTRPKPYSDAFPFENFAKLPSIVVYQWPLCHESLTSDVNLRRIHARRCIIMSHWISPYA
jgi:hypothetical protein